MADYDPSTIAIGLAKDAYKQGRLVLFVGAGVSQSCGYPGWAQLVAPLAEKVGHALPENPSAEDFVTALQLVEQRRSRGLICVHYKEHLNDPLTAPCIIHDLFSVSTVDTIYTTNYDTLIETSLQYCHQKRTNLVLNAGGLATRPADSVNVIKLCGDISADSENIITFEDYHFFEEKKEGLVNALKGDLQSKTVLFLGYSMGDPFTQKLVLEAIKKTDRKGEHVVLALGWPAEKVEMWRGLGIQVIERMPAEQESGNPDFTTPVENVLRDIFDVPKDMVVDDHPLKPATTLSLARDAEEFHPVDKSPTGIDQDRALDSSIAQPLSGQLDDHYWEEQLKEYQQKDFSDAKEKLDAGKLGAAREDFEKLYERTPDADQDFRQRIRFNIGLSYYYAGNSVDANREFKAGLELSGNEKRQAIFGALSALLDDRPEDVLLLLEPYGDEEVDIIRARANALHAGKGADAAIEYLRGIEEQGPEVLATLAEILSSENRFAEAEEILRELQENEDDWLCSFRLGTAIVYPLLTKLNKLQVGAYCIPREDRIRLEEGSLLLKKAEEYLENTERDDMRMSLWINLSAVESSLGRPEVAISFAEKAVALKADDESAVRNLYIACMQSENYSRAAEVAEKLFAIREQEDTLGRWSAAHLADGAYDKAMNVLELWESKYTRPDDDFYCMRARCRMRFAQDEKAKESLDEGLAAHPRSAVIRMELANYYLAANNSDEAEKYFKEAERKARQHGVKYLIRQEFGSFLFRQERWKEARDKFIRLGDDPLLCPNIDLYLTCFLNLNEIQGGYDRLKELLDKGLRPTPSVHDVAARIHRAMSDLGSALHNAEQAFKMEPHPNRAALLVELYHRTNQPERAVEIAHSYCQKNPESIYAQLNAAQAKFVVGRFAEAFEHSAKAIELDPDSKDAHMMLSRFAFQSAEFSLDDSQGELVRSSIRFLVDCEDAPIYEVQFDAEFTQLKEMAKDRSELAQELEKAYKDVQVPLCFVSKNLGIPYMEAHDACMAGNFGGYRMALGSSEEQNLEYELAQSTESITVDLSALLTLQMLGKLDLLLAVYPQAQVPWPVYELIRTEIESLEMSPPETTTGYHEGQLTVTDYPENYWEEKKTRYTELLSYLEGGIRRVGVNPDVLQDDVVHALGDAFVIPLKIAEGTNAPLYSDELLMRHLINDPNECRSFCTQAFLRTAVTRGKMTDDEYDDCILRLIEAKYDFVSDRFESLWHTLVRNNFVSSPSLELLLARIHHPTITKEMSASMLGAYAGRVMFSVGRKGDGREKLINQVAAEFAKVPVTDFMHLTAPFITNAYKEVRDAPELLIGLYDMFKSSEGVSRQHAMLFRTSIDTLLGVLAEKADEFLLFNEKQRVNAVIHAWNMRKLLKLL